MNYRIHWLFNDDILKGNLVGTIKTSDDERLYRYSSIFLVPLSPFRYAFYRTVWH